MKAMRHYGSVLERTGAVVEWLPAGQLDCVLMAQLVRNRLVHSRGKAFCMP